MLTCYILSDQYLNFSSHHPVEHKLSVIRTLLERSQYLVTVSQDKIQEDAHVEEALQVCGYPPWSFSKVRCQMEFKSDKRKKKNKKQEALVKRPMIIIPYVEKVLAAIVTIMKKHNVPVAMNLGRHCMIYWCTEGQTRQGRHKRMCIQGSLCQRWPDVCRRNWKKLRVRLHEQHRSWVQDQMSFHQKSVHNQSDGI